MGKHLLPIHDRKSHVLGYQASGNHSLHPGDALVEFRSPLCKLPPALTPGLAFVRVPLRLDSLTHDLKTLWEVRRHWPPVPVRGRVAIQRPILEVDDPSASRLVWARVEILSIQIAEEDLPVVRIAIQEHLRFLGREHPWYVPYEKWKEVVDINLNAMFLCSQEAVRIMKAQQPKGGRIINNGSISAHAPRPNTIAYTATKHAVTGLTRSISLDGRQHDIACGQIDIGNAATEMTERMAMGVAQADGSLKAEDRMDVRHVAESLLHMANLPLDANVLFMTVMATKMPFVGRG